MRFIYSIIIYMAVPFILLRLWVRSRKAAAYGLRWKERFAYINVPPAWQNGLWVHAVSVGEVLAAIPLIKAIRGQYPDLPITMTTMTPTGSARVQASFGDTVYHVYVPYDIPTVVQRFLDRVKPQAVMILETELWPNIFYYVNRRGIPLFLANARLSERSEKGYAKIGSTTRQMLSCVSILAAHAKEDAERFIALSMDPSRVTVTGSIKFEIKVPSSLMEQGASLRRFFGANRSIWIAASTHNGEEEIILAAHKKVLETIPNALLVLVPRHPERFNEVVNLTQKKSFTVVRRSTHNVCLPQTQVFVGDTMGEVLLFFSAVDVAFIGGSLIPNGGHNLLEPAALGVATVTGYSHFNFKDITNLLLQANAIIQVWDADDLAETVIDLLQNSALRTEMGERGRKVIEQNRGALAAHLTLMEKLFKN
jgi:3-deoxy-D-manno-octulosonic-acid transferase